MAHRRIILTLILFAFMLTATFVSAQPPDTCDTEEVIAWMQTREAFSERFEAVDQQVSANLTDWRGIPRYDLVIEAQQIRREFEDTPFPPCAHDLYFATAMYWVRRIDRLTTGLNNRQRPDSVQAEQDYFQQFVVPALQHLEYVSDLDYYETVQKERPENTPTLPAVIVVGETVVSNPELERVVSVDRITLPNCNGADTLTVSRLFSSELEPEIRLFPQAMSSAIAQDTAREHLVASDDFETGIMVGDSLTIEMQAAPGTIAAYEIEWVETSLAGVIEVQIGDSTEFVEFTIAQSLRPNVRELMQTTCESALQPEATAEASQ